MANLYQPSLLLALDTNGDPVPGAEMHFFLTGTTTRAAVYTNQTGSTEAANPVVADSAGRFAPVYLDATATYRIRLTGPLATPTYYDVDPVRGYDAGAVQTAADAAVAAGAAASASASAAAVSATSSATSATEAEASAAESEGHADRAEQASLVSGAYPNAYASALPKGVTATTISNAGTGYTPGTYALGVADGPTGFAATYTVGSGGTVESIAITNPGLSTSTSAPTLSFPSGGGTGAAATATVGNLITDQRTYWAALDESRSMGLFRNNGGTLAEVVNVDGDQIAMPQATLVSELLARFGSLSNTPYVLENPEFQRVRFSVVTQDGAWPENGISVRYLFRDTVSAPGDRLQCYLVDPTDNTLLASPAAGGAWLNPTTSEYNGGVGIISFPMVLTAAAASAGITYIEMEVDLGEGENFGGTSTHAGDDTALAPQRAGMSAATAEQVERIANERIAARSVLLSTATDFVLAQFLSDIVIIGADEDDDCWINWQAQEFAGPLFRFKLRQHSTKYGREVARFDYEAATSPAADPKLAQGITLSLRVDASNPDAWPDDVGISAHVTPNWDAITSWTQALTEHTDNSATGIVRGKVQTAATTKAKWSGIVVPTPRHATYGAGGDFATIRAAIEALEYSGFASTISRSTWPSSTIASEAWPFALYPTGAHEEEVEAFTYLGIDQSRIRIPHGVVLYTRPDTLIYMDSTSTAPTIEFNFTGALYGQGTIERRGIGSGYVIHMDPANVITALADGEAPIVRRALQKIIDGPTIRRVGDHTAVMIGGGLGNGEYTSFRRCHFDMAATTQAASAIGYHNSPNEVVPGLLEIIDCTSNYEADWPAVPFLNLIKNNASTIAHEFSVRNSDCHLVSVTNSVGGDPGWRRRGSMGGAALVPDSVLLP